MPAWYDILDMSIDRKVDLIQLNSSATAIQKLIEREIKRGIESDKIILAGFSQGGAVAYQAALTFHRPLAGLLAMSTYFATKETITLHNSNKLIDINIMHGNEDPVVASSLGKQALSALNGLGFTPSYTEYSMQHSVCPLQISDISAWIQSRLV